MPLLTEASAKPLLTSPMTGSRRSQGSSFKYPGSAVRVEIEKLSLLH